MKIQVKENDTWICSEGLSTEELIRKMFMYNIRKLYVPYSQNSCFFNYLMQDIKFLIEGNKEIDQFFKSVEIYTND